ncbi:MAG: arylsulfatase [Planctomycetia bacterium]
MLRPLSILVLAVGAWLLDDGTQLQAKPNVIVILSDDQGYGDLSCHGNPVLKTPNLDRLHSQSIRLTDFHVAPMCTPTRGQLLTGMDALRNGATSVTAGRTLLRPGIVTLPELFSRQGYKTAIFGKWHLGDSFPNLPQYKGFQDSVIHLGWGITSIADTWLNDYFDGRFYRNGKLEQFQGYCTDIFFRLSMEWMKERQAKSEPFFLYLPTNAPHGPHWVADRYSMPYQGKGPAKFFGMISNLDENIGKLDDFLQQSGLAKDTILVFMNDNGATAGEKVFNAGMRGRKTTYYDGGHRAICFIRWPGQNLGNPRDILYTSQIQDIYPTLLELCKLSPSANSRLDGISLAPLLLGSSKPMPDRKLVVQYGQKPQKNEACVLWNHWRLVHGRELYHIGNDPAQKEDLASSQPEILRTMQAHYDQWWSRVEPLLDDFVPIVIGSEKQNPVTLTSADWANVYCDNMNDLRNGKRVNSNWNILPAKEGTYEIALSRWPKEAGAGLAEKVPPFKAVDGILPEGKALPVASVRLKIGTLDKTVSVKPSDREARFTVDLQAGQKLSMQSWLLDSSGNELAGAYFARVTRK